MTKSSLIIRGSVAFFLFFIHLISLSQINTGNGLYSEKIHLTSNGKKIERNKFYYGEVIKVHFENLTGLTEVNEYVFPGMSITVVNSEMDTIFNNPDLYKEMTEGVNYKPLQLTATLTCANPMHTNNDYTLLIHIWDKKGKGTNDLKMNFQVDRNPKFVIENKSASIEEIYIYSPLKNSVVNDNEIVLGEKIYYVFEGISGFKLKNGQISAGMSMNVKDDDGKIILSNDDLIGDKLFSEKEFQSQITASFVMSGMVVKNPIEVELIIWDKYSKNKIKLTSQLIILL
ncbi:hypothetical protein OO013_02820 [Mangrovivirga sp. M17]|uniref:Uncharacterized protein n=1 Tax=Mangrovivirga halotolerans TaxID=2993936 RepID=A0ABT3RNP4_9BACT|nr:hypothetical protein [Mangrovivirga halotolerans]MCX2742780.1 hypothetical protein [Mangrovivirga halotolerans]